MDYLILFVFLLLSAFFAGVEIAFFSLPDLDVEKLVEKKVRGALLVKKLKANPQELLITSLIGSNVSNIAAASYATVVATRLFGSSGVGIATGVMSLLILVFGDLTPKAFCSFHAEKISLKCAPLMLFLNMLFRPVGWPLGKLVVAMTGEKVNTPLVTDVSLKLLTEIGVKEGTVDQSEKEMITNVFHLHDLRSKDIMRPIHQVECLNAEATLGEVKEILLHAAYSRFPLYEQRPENIIGVIHRDDALIALYEGREDESLISFRRLAHFFPEEVDVDDLLRRMQNVRSHMMIIKNKDGVATGMVTMEDILEQVVGDILDETDLEEQYIRRLSKDTILALGKTQMVDINNYFNVRLMNHRTVDGFIKSIYEMVPEEGEIITIGPMEIKIVDKEVDKVKVVKIRKKAEL